MLNCEQISKNVKYLETIPDPETYPDSVSLNTDPDPWTMSVEIKKNKFLSINITHFVCDYHKYFIVTCGHVQNKSKNLMLEKIQFIYKLYTGMYQTHTSSA